VEYVFTASNLHPASPSNHLCKYADDTYLLVPASNSSSIPLEIQHISDWATANNLKLNNTKSQEMIVHLPRNRKHFSNPIAIYGIERVDKMNILGITVSHTLTFHHHIAVLVTKSARSFYALKTIRNNGLNGNALWDVTRATLVSQLLYASLLGGDISKPMKGTGSNPLQLRPYGTVRLSPTFLQHSRRTKRGF